MRAVIKKRKRKSRSGSPGLRDDKESIETERIQEIGAMGDTLMSTCDWKRSNMFQHSLQVSSACREVAQLSISPCLCELDERGV